MFFKDLTNRSLYLLQSVTKLYKVPIRNNVAHMVWWYTPFYTIPSLTQNSERKVSPSAATLTINIHRKHIYESHSAGEAPYVKLRVKRLGREAAFFYSKIVDLNEGTS